MKARRVTVLLLAGLAVCATQETAQVVPVLQPFLAAGRFVPKGMTSFACEAGAFRFPDVDGTGFPAKCVVSAGRDFGPPAKGLGLGPSRTIWIVDTGGMGAERSLGEALHDARTETDTVGWLPATHVLPRGKYDLDVWCTVVEDRFVLVALQRDLLRDALALATDLGSELASFGDLAFLPEDATDLLFRKELPLQQNIVRHGPLDGLLVGVIRPGPWRIDLFSRVPPTDTWDVALDQLCSPVEVPEQAIGGWWLRGGVLREQMPLAESTTARLWWLTLFGHCIFI